MIEEFSHSRAGGKPENMDPRIREDDNDFILTLTLER